MDDSFLCPSCKSALRRSPQLTPGVAVKCPRCNHVFTVPEEEIPLAPLLTEAVADRPIPPPEPAPRRRGRDFDFDDEDREYSDRRGRARRRDVNLTSDYRANIGPWFTIATRHWGDFLGPFIGFAFLCLVLMFFVGLVAGIINVVTMGLGAIITFPVTMFIAAALFNGPLNAAIRAVQNKEWSFNDMFSGFEYFGAIALYTFLIGLINAVIYSPAIAMYIYVIVSMVGGMRGGGPPRISTEIGIFLLGWVYLIAPLAVTAVQAKFTFTLGLIFEQRMDAIKAMGTSWKMTDGHFWALFGFQLLCVLLLFAGAIACLIGLLFTGPLVVLLQAAAYVDVTNQPTDGRRDRHERDGDDEDDDRPRPPPRRQEDERSPRYRSRRDDEDY